VTTIPFSLQIEADGPFRGSCYSSCGLEILDRGDGVSITLHSLGRSIGRVEFTKAALAELLGTLGQHLLERP
jgi:hypothetical protein